MSEAEPEWKRWVEELKVGGNRAFVCFYWNNVRQFLH